MGTHRRFGGWASALWAPAVSGSLVACSTACTTPQTRPQLDVDSPEALVDQPIRIQITGVAAHQPVTITAATDTDRTTWRADATFVADAGGVVDLTTAAPESGSYQGVDGMGLFWSMSPDGGDGDTEVFRPESVDGGGSYAVSLSAAVDGLEVASMTVRRVLAAADVKVRALTLDADGVLTLLSHRRMGRRGGPGAVVGRLRGRPRPGRRRCAARLPRLPRSGSGLLRSTRSAADTAGCSAGVLRDRGALAQQGAVGRLGTGDRPGLLARHGGGDAACRPLPRIGTGRRPVRAHRTGDLGHPKAAPHGPSTSSRCSRARCPWPTSARRCSPSPAAPTCSGHPEVPPPT